MIDMKRLLTIFLLLMIVVSLVSCGSNDSLLPKDMDPEFYYTSGAGAWYTELILNADGAFEGTYNDSEGDKVYVADFTGKFGDIKQINDYTYSMTLTELNTERPAGEEWTQGEVHYIASAPNGLLIGAEYVLYTPDAPTAELSDDFLSWHPRNINEETADKLGCYGICGDFDDSEIGFFNRPNA